MQTIPVAFYSALSYAPDKSWQIGMLPNATTSELLNLLAPTVGAHPNQIALFLRAGNNDQQVPDNASPVAVLHQFSQANPQVYFVIKERQQQYQQRQYQEQQQYQHQQQYQQQYQQPQSQPMQPQPQQYASNSPSNSPHGSFGSSGSGAQASELQNQLSTVTEELKKMDTQKGLIEQKTKQLQSEIQGIDKKLIQIQAFASNFPAGTKETLLHQKQQYLAALQKLSQTVIVLNDKVQKYTQFSQVLENRILQAEQAEKEISKVKSLQQASSLTFEPNMEYEQQLTAPDYIQKQIDMLLTQMNLMGQFNLAEKLICLLQSNCPMEKSIRLLLHLATDPTNREKIAQTRLLPVILNLLQSDMDVALRRSLFSLLANMTSSDACRHSLAKAGIIPIVAVHLDHQDSGIVDSALAIVSEIMIDDMYRVIFQHHNGTGKLIHFFTQGTPKQQMKTLDILSRIGFSEEEDAIRFVNEPGNLSAICDLIDAAENEGHRNMALRIVISLTKLAPVQMIENNSVGRVIQLIDCNSENIPLLKLSLESVIPLLVNTYIRRMICERILGDLIQLLDSSDQELMSCSLAVLAGVLDEENRESLHQAGVEKVINIYCNTSTTQADIENALQILSVVGFSSAENQLEFATQGGIEITLTFLMTEDKPLVQEALGVLSHLNEHHSAIINHSKRAKLILSHLVQQIEDVEFTNGFLRSILLICMSGDIPVLNHLAEANIFGTLTQLISHFDEKLVFVTLEIIKALCRSPTCQMELIRAQGIQPIISLISSPNQEVRHVALDLISHLTSISNEIHIAFAQNRIIYALTEIESKEKASYILQVLNCLANDYQIQCDTRDSKLLVQILRHLRSKDMQLTQTVIQVLTKLSRDNLTVIETLHSQGAIVQVIRLLESFLLRMKLQVTDRLILSMNQTLQLLVHTSVCAPVRYYLREKTIIKVSLKKFRGLNDPALNRTATVLQALLSFPAGENESSFSTLPQNILQSLQATTVPSLSQLHEADTLWEREKLLNVITVELQEQETNQQGQAKAKTPEQQERNELAKKISLAEEEFQNAKDRCQQNQLEMENIKETIGTIQSEISVLEEMNDEILLPEIERKKQDLVDAKKLLDEGNAIALSASEFLADAEAKVNASQADKNRLRELTEQMTALQVSDKQGSDERFQILMKFYTFVSSFMNDLRLFQRGYITSIQRFITTKALPISSDDLHSFKQLQVDIQEISRSTTMLLEKLDCHLHVSASSQEYELGKDLFTFAEFLTPFLLFSKHYETLVESFSRLSSSDTFNRLLEPIQKLISLSSFAYYPMSVFRMCYYLCFFTSALVQATDVSSPDYRTLISTQRKLNNLITSLSRKTTSIQNQVPLKEERYQKLVALLNGQQFMFLDVFGEHKESEKIVAQCVRLFATQGMISAFLEHQITKEVSECVGESTLFRGKTFAAQCLSAFSHIVDSDYLLNSLAIYLRRLHASEASLEVNHRLIGSNVSEKDPQVQKNQELLRKECELAFAYINGTANQCTRSLKNVCYSLRRIVGKRFPGNDISSVGGLFFLRFICPCFVTPERFQICKAEEINKDTRRNCILVSKVLQNLSNQVRFALKEPFMVPLNEFLDEYTPKMQALLKRISEKYYPEEALEILKDTDLYDIHLCLHTNRSLIETQLQENGSISLKEEFVAVMNNLGTPEAPVVAASLDSPSKSKRRLSVRLKRRRGSSTALPVANLAEKKFYFALVNQLVQPNYSLAQSVWTIADSKSTDTMTKAFVRLFDHYGCGVDCARILIEQEVQGCTDPATLFRANSFPPKYVSEFSQFIGHDYLVSIIGPLIKKMQSSDISLEVDSNRLNKDESLAAKGQKLLGKICQEWFQFIASKADSCPIKLKLACKYLKHYVNQKFPANALMSVGGLFFLRFICPAIINPERLKLLDTPLTSGHRRNLVMICKVLQNLSNDILFGKKEPFMIPLNDFLTSYRPKMIQLLEKLAEIPENSDTTFVASPHKNVTDEYKECLEIVHAVINTKRNEIQRELESNNADDCITDGYQAILIQMEAAFPPETVNEET